MSTYHHCTSSSKKVHPHIVTKLGIYWLIRVKIRIVCRIGIVHVGLIVVSVPLAMTIAILEDVE